MSAASCAARVELGRVESRSSAGVPLRRARRRAAARPRVPSTSRRPERRSAPARCSSSAQHAEAPDVGLRARRPVGQLPPVEPLGGLLDDPAGQVAADRERDPGRVAGPAGGQLQQPLHRRHPVGHVARRRRIGQQIAAVRPRPAPRRAWPPMSAHESSRSARTRSSSGGPSSRAIVSCWRVSRCWVSRQPAAAGLELAGRQGQLERGGDPVVRARPRHCPSARPTRARAGRAARCRRRPSPWSAALAPGRLAPLLVRPQDLLGLGRLRRSPA